jgi:hypothetical protein
LPQLDQCFYLAFQWWQPTQLPSPIPFTMPSSQIWMMDNWLTDEK